MNTIKGFLFCKLDRLGTRSEGPEYFLQQYNYQEIKVSKKAELWEEDPSLHALIANKVIIKGSQADDIFVYNAIAETSSRNREK